MSIEANKKIAMRMSDEAVNQRKMETADELISKDYRYYGPGGMELEGTEGFKQMIGGFRNAFPDLHSEIKNLTAEGDYVLMHYTFVGTHQADFMGIPATGKKIDIWGFILRRINDGQIVEDRDMYDAPTFMKQLGVSQ